MSTTGKIYLGDILVSDPSASGGSSVEYEPRYSIISQSSSNFTASVESYYRFSSDVDTITITLPVPSDSYTHSIFFKFTTGTSPNITFSSTEEIDYYSSFAIDASTTYEVNALYNGSEWVIACSQIDVSISGNTVYLSDDDDPMTTAVYTVTGVGSGWTGLSGYQSAEIYINGERFNYGSTAINESTHAISYIPEYTGSAQQTLTINCNNGWIPISGSLQYGGGGTMN